ncbi:helix-turn-helix domain-containing protein [Kribbella shirazensis]|uniref:Integrase n=1 Tax=Kribbella shirazensis TaxID=1105143 RepID=A0A7X6A4X5_9ACTN|nr:helix-turn-helix domain-containing protein [Kribbella shirazensis]NIK61460.1 integrase [Kribbella shirazensis]
MPRTPLPIGTWGEISTRTLKTKKNGKPVKHLAHARFRDHDGKVRAVTATGTTKTAARTALLAKLQNRAKTNHSGDLSTNHTVNHLLDLWERRFEGLVADGTRSPTTLATYRRALKNHVRPAIGELHISEATTQRLDVVLTDIKDHAGAPTARTCRAVISGAMNLAVRYGAITTNPAREVDAIEARPKSSPRALTAEEVTLLNRSLTADEHAVEADLPDLVTFMLATGVRIGEALAVLWNQVDLDAGTVEITHTIARPPGEGLIRKTTKSRTGQRVLSLPTWAAAMLRGRHTPDIHPDAPVFPDTIGCYRDPSNTRRSLRTALSPVGSTARRELGQTLQALRRQNHLSRKQVAQTLGWPQTRIELIETGRIKPTHRLVSTLTKTYGINLDRRPDLLTQLTDAAQPAESDQLAWIHSHALRKTTATALDQAGQTARQIADHLGQAKVSITQDIYMGRRIANPAAAQALEHAFDDHDLR